MYDFYVMELNNNKFMQPEWEVWIQVNDQKTNKILIWAHTEFVNHKSTCCVHDYNIDAMWKNKMFNPYFD